MKEQSDLRLPATGEGWRHYKGGSKSLYTIIGMASDANGVPTVVYTPFGWSLVQLPAIYVRPLAEFLQDMDVICQRIDERPRKVGRFTFEREAGGDLQCPFIHPICGAGFRRLDT